MSIWVDEKEINKILPELNKFDNWLPLALFRYINPVIYFNNVSDEIITDFYNRKHDSLLVERPDKLMENELELWVEENPQYNHIIKEVKE